MRLTLVTLALAIGVVVFVLVTNQAEHDDRKGAQDPTPDKSTPPPVTKPGGPRTRSTPTKLSEHKYLSELERVLERDDLSHALAFRQKVCEQIDEILESKRLTGNLLGLIRKHAIGTGDTRRRDLLLPILLVMKHPEATALIRTAYAEATTDDERLMLIHAMVREHHDQKTASGWVIDRAVSAKSKEDRTLAFRIMDTDCKDTDLCFQTANAIYGATTREDQARDMAAAISRFGDDSDSAQAWIRTQLKKPKPGELLALMAGIHSWGTERDAKDLEGLATEFPTMAAQLHERAKAIREYLLALSGDAPDAEKLRHLEDARRKKELEGKADPGKRDRDG